MIDIVLYQPEIPPNTGNIIRLAANTGAALHLVEPLGFQLEDRELKRAGLDYHEYASLIVHKDWRTACEYLQGRRLFAFSTHALRPYTEPEYREDDVLVFGPETRGLPPEIFDAVPQAQRLRLPLRPGNRSLNLSNAVAVAVYEAWRQLGFAGAK
ncbi:MAG: tRNA (cytidine(34)-2'-O)-methyltransferase [Burkholderiales bacterium]|nr:tRNA (cytidine(34)-2'-O)-methyltransferase [Burkholderiales bacterium]